MSERLTVLVDHYPQTGQKPYVGFTIKGARHFLADNGWELAHSVRFEEVVNAVLKSFPGVAVEWFVEKVARPLMEDQQIERVDIPQRASTQVSPAYGL
ncbi:MAG TPA: hypothetical protein VGN17_13090 [Bryobacteraceae bacterium]